MDEIVFAFFMFSIYYDSRSTFWRDETLNWVRDFFINFTVIISSLFIYQQLFKDWPLNKDSSINRKLIAGIASGLLGNILMLFSIHVTNTTIIDLRHIPMMLSIIFGGFFPAFISFFLITVGRFVIGINTSSAAALIFMATTLIGYSFLVHIRQRNLMKSFIMLFYTNIVFSIIFYIVVPEAKLFIKLIPLYWLVSFAGGLVSVYLVEYLRNTHHLFKQYKEHSTVDFLTGLGNLRSFERAFNKMVKETKEKEEEASLIYLDIDHFKKINDSYGHNEGDLVLKQLGKLLLENTRSYDIVSRNGGEEFTVLLPDCPLTKAAKIGEKIRKIVESNAFLLSNGLVIHATISLGIAHFPSTVQTPENLLKKADDALYQAKNNGRNQVVCAQPM